MPLENLCLSPQCGFASCEVGNKLTEEQQWAKLALVKEIAEEVWGKGFLFQYTSINRDFKNRAAPKTPCAVFF